MTGFVEVIDVSGQAGICMERIVGFVYEFASDTPDVDDWEVPHIGTDGRCFNPFSALGYFLPGFVVWARKCLSIIMIATKHHYIFRLLPLTRCSATTLFRFTLSTRLVKLRLPFPSAFCVTRSSLSLLRLLFCLFDRSSSRAAMLFVFLKLKEKRKSVNSTGQ